jgi:hypothetical protein
MPKYDIFSDNHAFKCLSAYVCSLVECKHARVEEHPHLHSVPTLADGASVTFKMGKTKCAASVERIDRVVGLEMAVAVMRKLTLVVPDYSDFERKAHEHWEAGTKGKLQVWYARYNPYNQEWDRAALLPRRSMDTIEFDHDTMAQLRTGIKTFLKGEKEYDKAGRPYKMVTMLHGAPGCGKTSAVYALLSEFKFENVYVMSFGATMTDSNFLGLVHSMSPSKSALILEDADTLVVNRKDKQGMSFTTMLNVLDGYLRPHGLMCFMTTNKLEVFDEAMTREGRMDMLVHVKPLSPEGATSLATRLIPKAVPAKDRKALADAIVKKTTNPSKISSFLFLNRERTASEILKALSGIDGRRRK